MNVAFLQPGDVKQMGWYWFQPGDNSPAEMRRGLPVVVMVGIADKGQTVVRFPQGLYYCRAMGGLFVGPLECPFK